MTTAPGALLWAQVSLTYAIRQSLHNSKFTRALSRRRWHLFAVWMGPKHLVRSSVDSAPGSVGLTVIVAHSVSREHFDVKVYVEVANNTGCIRTFI